MDTEKQKILAKVKELISAAEIGKAIDLIQEYLSKEKKYSKLYRISVEVEAFLNKTKKDEAKAIISFENAKLNYNQVTNQFLNLIESLEQGILDPDVPTGFAKNISKTPRNKKNIWIAGLVLLIILAGFGLWQLSPSLKSNEVCPSFNPISKFNILILPFIDPSGEKGAKPELTIQQRLLRLSSDKRVEAEVEIFGSFTEENEGIPSYNEAGEIGKGCNANLIIWGLVEKNVFEKSFDIITNFKFLGKKEFFELNQIKFEGANEASNLKTLSKIATQGQLTQNIEETILLLFGILSREQGDHEAAIATLEQVNATDSTSTFLSNIFLADSYIETEKPEEAASALDSVIDVKPNYWLALSNRAMIKLEEESSLEAIEDLSAAIVLKKDDPSLWQARAMAYDQIGQWKMAEENFEEVVKLEPDNEIVKKDLVRVKTKIEEENEIIKQSKNNPRTSKSIRDQTNALYKTGQIEKAEKSVQRINVLDASTYAERIVYLIEKGDYDKVRAAYKDAESKGIKKEAIFKEKPALEKYYYRRLNTKTKN